MSPLSIPDFSDDDRMIAVDLQLSHVWMVRAFLKHSEEAAEDEELASVHRDLYDYMLALGAAFEAGDSQKYLRLARKKLSKLRRATQLFQEIRSEVSGHMNFKMAELSLRIAVEQIVKLLDAKGQDIPIETDETEEDE